MTKLDEALQPNEVVFALYHLVKRCYVCKKLYKGENEDGVECIAPL